MWLLVALIAIIILIVISILIYIIKNTNNSQSITTTNQKNFQHVAVPARLPKRFSDSSDEPTTSLLQTPSNESPIQDNTALSSRYITSPITQQSSHTNISPISAKVSPVNINNNNTLQSLLLPLASADTEIGLPCTLDQQCMNSSCAPHIALVKWSLQQNNLQHISYLPAAVNKIVINDNKIWALLNNKCIYTYDTNIDETFKLYDDAERFKGASDLHVHKQDIYILANDEQRLVEINDSTKNENTMNIPTGNIRQIAGDNDTLLAHIDDHIYKYDNNNWLELIASDVPFAYCQGVLASNNGNVIELHNLNGPALTCKYFPISDGHIYHIIHFVLAQIAGCIHIAAVTVNEHEEVGILYTNLQTTPHNLLIPGHFTRDSLLSFSAHDLYIIAEQTCMK